MRSRTLKVDTLARVEGEGRLVVKMKNGSVKDVELNIYEPPRFFEAFLRGRKYSEVPDITARICGICPVAYQMSSVQAIEDAFGLTVSPSIKDLRRLMYCGEWIESHVLHIAMLHTPDFLGLDDALELARRSPEVVHSALRMKKAGNQIMRVLGGREIHPVSVCVGGFYKTPSTRELQALLDELRWGLDAAIGLTRLVAGFEFPDLEPDYEFVALSHPQEYAINEGRILSSSGLDIAVREYEFYFEERHVQHSNALQSFEKGRGSYVVGPLARFNLNYECLPRTAKQVAGDVRVSPPLRNPFKSIIVRGVETVFAFEEAIRLIEHYDPPEQVVGDYVAKAGIGFGATEAPRGLLYHRYRIGEDRLIADAKIVPPTAQNQSSIESDVKLFVNLNHTMPRDELTRRSEQVIRNYDPCISCATHFLRLEVVEQP